MYYLEKDPDWKKYGYHIPKIAEDYVLAYNVSNLAEKIVLLSLYGISVYSVASGARLYADEVPESVVDESQFEQPFSAVGFGIKVNQIASKSDFCASVRDENLHIKDLESPEFVVKLGKAGELQIVNINHGRVIYQMNYVEQISQQTQRKEIVFASSQFEQVIFSQGNQ